VRRVFSEAHVLRKNAFEFFSPCEAKIRGVLPSELPMLIAGLNSYYADDIALCGVDVKLDKTREGRYNTAIAENGRSTSASGAERESGWWKLSSGQSEGRPGACGVKRCSAVD